MKDGPIRRVIKRVVLISFYINMSVTRRVMRLRGERPYRLGGACNLCAACCEAPTMQVGRAVFYLPMLRWLFLAWHRHVNGFELVKRESGQRLFVFRCTHFDVKTRRCDSYDSRPGMCRDYPRVLLWQGSPDFLPGCGYRAVDPRAGRLVRALEAEGVSPEKVEKARRRLMADDPRSEKQA